VYLLDDQVDGMRPSVRMIDPAGIVRTVAGDSYRDDWEGGFGGDGGPATRAELNNPQDIATGPDGTLYIADTHNSRIRAVDPAGTITTFAGTGQRADSGDDAAATQAALNEPQTIAVGADGAVHVITSDGDRIRQIAKGTTAH
jgi:sugar lactone lactonase YvrE